MIGTVNGSRHGKNPRSDDFIIKVWWDLAPTIRDLANYALLKGRLEREKYPTEWGWRGSEPFKQIMVAAIDGDAEKVERLLVMWGL